MTIWDVVAIVGCGVIGFWLVSVAFDVFRKKTAHDSPGGSAKRQSRPNDGPSQELKWFEVLGVAPTASLDEIKTAYRERARQYHPDRVQGLGKEFGEIAERKMKELNSAYNYALRAR
jgi:DnaJ-domain-containing protein 1